MAMINSRLTPAVQTAVRTLLFYLGYWLLSYVLELLGPSGPCAPGLGLWAIILLPFVSILLLMVAGYKLYRGKKEQKIALFIHLAVLVLFGFLFYFNYL